METFTIYDQRQPVKQGDNYKAYLVEVGKIQASSIANAIQQAKELRLSRWPIVWSPTTESMRERFPRFNEYTR